jgi:hypothetical protein
VRCATCGTVLAEPLPGASDDRRPPCPQCGSTARRVEISLEDGVFSQGLARPETIAIRVGMPSVEAQAEVATVSATAYEATVRAEDGKSSTMGLRVAHKVELRFHEAEDVPDRRFYVEVHRGGEVIACGYGNDEAEAILDLIWVLVPPDHPHYEELTEQPDDLL